MVTEIQQGLPVKQDYRLHRVAGDIQQGYWFRELPAPECCRFRSFVGSGVLPVTEESVPILKGKKPASNPVLTTGLPVPECCWFRNRSAAGYKKSTVSILTGKEPASNSGLTTGSTVSLLSEPTSLTGYRACLIAEKSC